MSEQLGIDNIKSVMKFMADTRNQTSDAMADGKITWIEGVGFLPLIMRTPELVNKAKQTLAEIKDASHPERAELETYAIEVLLIPSAEVEEFIADCCDWIILTIKIIDKGTKLAA